MELVVSLDHMLYVLLALHAWKMRWWWIIHSGYGGAGGKGFCGVMQALVGHRVTHLTLP